MLILAIKIIVRNPFQLHSTVSSGINSVTAVTFEDFLAKLKYFSNMGDIQQGRVSKFLGNF